MDLESAAAVLGVHYQTAYRWVRTGLLSAVKVGAGYELDPDHVATVAEERRQCRTVRSAAAPDCVAAPATLAAALASGDDVAARRLIERLQRDGVGPAAICDLVIAPALRHLDADRVAGSVLPGEVAVAAEICERLVGLLASPPRGRPRGLAIVASPDDERHRLPGLMATAALRADRWRVHHLGCGIPADDLAEFIIAEEPDLLVLSFAAVPADSVETVRKVTDGAVPLLVGSPGATLARLTADAQALCTPRRRPSGGPTREVPGPSFAAAG